MTLRVADANDIELLIKLRIDYLTTDLGDISLDNRQKIEAQLREYMPRSISDGTFIAIIAEDNSNILATAYLAISDNPANVTFINGKIGTLLNVLTYSEHQRQGIATQVVTRIIEEAKLRSVSRIQLLASPDGKRLYDKLGFSDARYDMMTLRLM